MATSHLLSVSVADRWSRPGAPFPASEPNMREERVEQLVDAVGGQVGSDGRGRADRPLPRPSGGSRSPVPSACARTLRCVLLRTSRPGCRSRHGAAQCCADIRDAFSEPRNDLGTVGRLGHVTPVQPLAGTGANHLRHPAMDAPGVADEPSHAPTGAHVHSGVEVDLGCSGERFAVGGNAAQVPVHPHRVDDTCGPNAQLRGCSDRRRCCDLGGCAAEVTKPTFRSCRPSAGGPLRARLSARPQWRYRLNHPVVSVHALIATSSL